jgi:hypothetical protein
VKVEHKIGRRLRRQIGFVAKQKLTARRNARSTDGPGVGYFVIDPELAEISGDPGQVIAGLNLDIAVGVGTWVVLAGFDEAARNVPPSRSSTSTRAAGQPS